MAVLFRYGVAVLLGASPDAERALRDHVSASTENPYESVESEELNTRLGRNFDHIEELALELERTGGIRGNTRGHLKHIGAMLLIESRMVGRAQMRCSRTSSRSTSASRPSTASSSSWRAPSVRSST